MRIALTGLVALAVAMGIGRFAFTPLLPMMQSDAGLSLAQGGWLASANYAGAGEQAARLMAALTAAFAAGQVAGPVFVSLLVQQGWSFDAGLLIAGAILAAGACALITRRP